ncbi:MAG: hypothetical protein AAGC93_09000 [Cyanobacteria bacterium P01_F01_bin.53]
MGFGAIITSGNKNKLLSERLMDCITEVRIEQFLDEPTQFAIRFQEDIVDDEPMIMKAPELQCEQMIAIAVDIDGELKCLVRGPITHTQCSTTLGGPGSSVQVQGQDRRIELDRKCVRKAWKGRASEAAERILSDVFDSTDITRTNIIYGAPRSGTGQATQTLNQRFTNEAFLKEIARRNNLCFWLSYECMRDRLDLTGQSLKIEETANLKPSPPRPQSNGLPKPPVDLIQLLPNVKVALRVNVMPDQCQNVTTFKLRVDPEQPNQFSGSALDESDLNEQSTTATDPQPSIRDKGQRLTACQAERDLCITTAGNAVELQNKAEAALTQTGWYVQAKADTTVHMLGGVLAPHDVLDVEGLGKDNSGPYQVKAVTHVINAADHFMEVGLRRNVVGGG